MFSRAVMPSLAKKCCNIRWNGDFCSSIIRCEHWWIPQIKNEKRIFGCSLESSRLAWGGSNSSIFKLWAANSVAIDRAASVGVVDCWWRRFGCPQFFQQSKQKILLKFQKKNVKEKIILRTVPSIEAWLPWALRCTDTHLDKKWV